MDFHFWTSISFFVVLAACGVATAQDKAETAKAVVPKFYCYQTKGSVNQRFGTGYSSCKNFEIKGDDLPR